MAGPRILCDAVSFGYGPIGKLLAICANLPPSFDLTLLAANSSFELAELSSFSRIIRCDTEEPSCLCEFRAEFENADLFLNVMNPVSAEYAASIGTPIAHVDSLFWMWDTVPTSLMGAAAYFIQSFVGVREQLRNFKIANPVLVGAIIDDRFQANEKANQLLINLGGLRSKLIEPGRNSNYAVIVAGALEQVLCNHTFDRILFTGDRTTMSALAQLHHIPRCRFTTLGHAEFLRELARSALLVTSPGLTTTYEAFAYHVPVVFLPPQNLSQFLILKGLRAQRAAPCSIHWLDFYPELDIEAGRPEDEGVRHVLSCIARFEGDKSAQRTLEDTLCTFLSSPSYEAMQSNQRNFIERHGANGALEVVAGIEALISS